MSDAPPQFPEKNSSGVVDSLINSLTKQRDKAMTDLAVLEAQKADLEKRVSEYREAAERFMEKQKSEERRLSSLVQELQEENARLRAEVDETEGGDKKNGSGDSDAIEEVASDDSKPAPKPGSRKRATH